MEHEFNVPKGFKVVVKFEKAEPEFKENDIVYTDNNGYKRVSVFQSFVDNTFISTKATFHITKNFTLTDEHLSFTDVRLATDSEKRLLFDKLKEKCLMFDGESIVRWRAGQYRKYFYLTGDGSISEDVDYGNQWDENTYNIGNYFPTKEMAESFQKVYIELFNDFHKKL